MASKVLIVEENPGVLEVLEAALRGEGFEVVVASDGIQALKAAQRERPDLVILDPMLAWLGGARVRQHARPESRSRGEPFIVLSPRTETSERVIPNGTKRSKAGTTFDVNELLARVRELQRHSDTSTPVGTVRAGVLEMDPDRWTVSVNGEPVALTAKEFGLLRMLLKAKGRVLTREMLREIVWEHDTDHRYDSRTVDVHVGRLRRKLGAAGRYVVTVRGVGYRFVPTAARRDD